MKVLPSILGLVLAGTATQAADSSAISSAVALAKAEASAKGEPLPYGHADFVPTPERPLGYRGDGNGWFPGATPVVEFYEGTPTKAEQAVRDNKGEEKKSTVWTYVDKQSKNLLWKTDLPGWSDAQPIPVKGRVFALCEPHFLVCLDAATGKPLWQRELLPLLFDGIPEAEARKKQDVINIARASGYLLAAVGENKELVAKAMEKIAAWKTQVAAIDNDPELSRAFDSIHETVRDFGDGKIKQLKLFPDMAIPTVNTVERRYKVPVNYVWQGNVGYAASTPVTDGEAVYVILPQGQVVSYDLDGNLRWGWRLKEWERLTVHHWPSPMLCGDVLMVRNLTGDIIGIERKTGKRLWETEIGHGGNHGSYQAHKLMRLTLPEGKPLDVVVTNKRKILRVADGKIVGEFPFEKWNNGHGPGIVGRGDMMYCVQTYDAPPSPLHAFRLKAENADTVTAELRYKISDEKGRGPFRGGSFILSDQFLTDNGPTWDAATGKPLWAGFQNAHTSIRVGRLSGGGGANLIGRYIIFPRRTIDSSRERVDESVINPCIVLDAADPANLRLVSEANLLGDTALPSDIFADRYLQEFEKRLFMGCYRGMAPWFGGRMGGIMPQGDRMYLQSAMALYCLGPAVKGTASDDPKVVAAIRAATTAESVTPHLTATSAQYRYEAVKALARLRAAGPQTDALKKMITEDPYEEIRAAAVEALDTTEPNALPGWTTLLTLYRASQATSLSEHQWQPQRRDREMFERTFAALGPVAGTRLTAAIAAAKDAKEKEALTQALAACGKP